jgi:SAM-dependent methyltransferase
MDQLSSYGETARMATSVCPLCDGSASRTITVHEQRFATGDAFLYAICGECGLVRLIDPPESMARYYTEYSYHVRRTKANDTRSRLKDFQQAVTGILMAPLERYVPEDTTLRVLDVGCARGDYLAYLKRLGFTEIMGMEPSQEAVSNCCDTSIPITCSSFHDFSTEVLFDVITLNQVFEHFPNPLEALAKLRELLAPNGLLVMSFPNHRSVARMLFGEFWPGYDAPRHYFCFCPKNVRMLAGRCGFRVGRIRYISRPSQFLGSFQYIWNRFSSSKQRLEEGFFRSSRVLDLLFFLPAYLLNFVKLGDMIEVHLVRDAEGNRLADVH